MAEMHNWLTPDSPATPSLAGALIVTVALPFADSLGISVKWFVLGLSVLFGILIGLSIAPPPTRVLRFLYITVNALLVFSVALGVGVSIDSPPKPPPPVPDELYKLISGATPYKSSDTRSRRGIASAFAQAPSDSKSEQEQQPESNTMSPSKKSESESSERTQPEGPPDASTKEQSSQELTVEQQELLERHAIQSEEYRKEQEEYNRRWSW